MSKVFPKLINREAKLQLVRATSSSLIVPDRQPKSGEELAEMFSKGVVYVRFIEISQEDDDDDLWDGHETLVDDRQRDSNDIVTQGRSGTDSDSSCGSSWSPCHSPVLPQTSRFPEPAQRVGEALVQGIAGSVPSGSRSNSSNVCC